MKTGVKYKIEIQDELVSVPGRTLISGYLRDQDIPVSLLADICWTWEWIKVSGAYRGKLPKRLARIMKDRYDKKLAPEQMSEIGNIAREHILPLVTHMLDFDNGLDWSAGDFGDFGSCFWTCHKPARNELRKRGVLAIRLYDKEAKGYARAWIYKIDNDTWLLFNAYGVTTQIMANIFAIFLSDKTGQSWVYDGICLNVNGDENGLIYLNANPQVIYTEFTAPPDEVNLDWDIGEYILCYYCEAYVEEGTEYHYRGNDYCYSCFKEVAVCCADCGDVIENCSDEYEHERATICSYCFDVRQEEDSK